MDPRVKEFIPDLADTHVRSALHKLLFFSLLIIGVPLACMFILKQVFESKFLQSMDNCLLLVKISYLDVFHYSHSDSLLYAAIIAVILVNVILGIFVYVAYTEDDTPKKVTEKRD